MLAVSLTALTHPSIQVPSSQVLLDELVVEDERAVEEETEGISPFEVEETLVLHPINEKALTKDSKAKRFFFIYIFTAEQHIIRLSFCFW